MLNTERAALFMLKKNRIILKFELNPQTHNKQHNLLHLNTALNNNGHKNTSIPLMILLQDLLCFSVCVLLHFSVKNSIHKTRVSPPAGLCRYFTAPKLNFKQSRPVFGDHG